jgi:hypothetical protein
MTEWTKEKIAELLETNDKAVGRALLRLAELQTADEIVAEDTKYKNGRGFRPCHAKMGTSMAKFYQKAGHLTPKQINYWRVKDKSGKSRIGIYAGQLLREFVKTA